MKTILSLLLSLTLFAAQAHAGCQGTNLTFCSKNFYGSGACNSSDALATLNDGTGFPNSTLIPPWEASMITIVGVEIVLLSSGPVQYMFSGNAYTPDIMTWLAPGQTRVSQFFPAGLGFKFPGTGTQTHIDLHAGCSSGNFAAMYTIYYTMP